MVDEINYKELINKYLEQHQEEGNWPILIKLNTNENILTISVSEDRDTVRVEDPIFAAFSFYETQTHLSLMKYTQFSDARFFHISKNSISSISSLSHECADMYARARVHIYDFSNSNDYIKNYLNSYSKMLEESMEQAEKYSESDPAVDANVISNESLSDEDVEKIWSSALESPSLDGKKGN